MHVRPHPLHSTSRSRCFAALAVSVLTPLLASCASPGPPRPPSLHLPEVVTDLSAQRAGDQVHLRWTTSSHTTDRLNAPSSITAEICREAHPAPETAQPAGKQTSPAAGKPTPLQTVPGCNSVLHLTVKPGESVADDRLPATLTSGPAELLRYRVRLLNPQGRSAGYSQGALAPAGAAPSSIAELKATSTRNGALLQWQPLEPGAWVELDRTLDETAKIKTPPKKDALSMADDQPEEIRLRTGDTNAQAGGANSKAEDDSAQAKDPGGTLDRSAQRGQRYIYRAQRVRTVELDGHRYELRSAFSAPMELAMTDRFPPAAPSGLAAIPGAEGDRSTIDLSWQPNVETDVAGYNVYRHEGSSGSFERISQASVLGPAFSDANVTPGHTYTYRVTAVDGSGNESPPSAETTETARDTKRP